MVAHVWEKIKQNSDKGRNPKGSIKIWEGVSLRLILKN